VRGKGEDQDDLSHLQLECARILTYTLIGRPPDCATIAGTASLAMTLVSTVKLSDQEKLAILRRLDQFRQWHSLDEKRYCLVCGEIITGREINVIGATRANGPLRITCPTEHCNAMPMEWVQPTDDVLIRIAMVEFERHWFCQMIRAGRAMQSLQKSNE
jgi:hypothetical protein